MQNIQMSTYLVEQADKHRNRMVLLLSAGVVTLVVAPFFNLLVGFSGGLILLMIFWFFGMTEHHKWAKVMEGIKGEDFFHACLSAIISKSDSVLYRGVPTDYGDIDYLLVGTNGIYAFEIKNHSGYINYNENGWKKVKISGGGLAYTGGIGNPSGQLGRNIMWLKNYLKSQGIENIWIKGIVVFTHPRARLSVKGLKNVMAITPEGIPDAVRGAEIGEEKAVRIVEAIEKLKETE